MPLTFKPSLFRNAALYELPQPVLAVRIQDTWDFQRFKVPLAAGEELTGHSINGAAISIEGRIGGKTGGPKTAEDAMFAELEALRAALDVGGAAGKYDFFLYHDDATETYRHFKACSTVRFDYDVSNKRLFAYAIVIHAEDPTIYTTAPGA